MSSQIKPWHLVPTQVVSGVRRALLMPLTHDVAHEFCREMADRQGVETDDQRAWKWLENARKSARKIGLNEYRNVHAIQQWHWRKLVYEMRRIEDMQP